MSEPQTAVQIDESDLIARLRQATGVDSGPVPLHEPRLDGAAWAYVKDTLDAGWVSSVGSYVDHFEAMLAETCGVRRAVATVNGTAALHVALLMAGVRPGDEVLVPALTFVATANAVSYCGAAPHFCDSETESFGIDAEKLAAHLAHVAEPTSEGCRNRRTGRRIAALLPVHVFGHPCDLAGLQALAQRWDLPLVEDAAEALGSRYADRPVGGGGRVAALSFNGNKIVTTGAGGAILTDNDTIADAAKHLTTTGKLAHRWRFDHDRVAFNYRLPNLNAALGVAQLERLPDFVAAKRRLAKRYLAVFEGFAGAHVVGEPSGRTSNYWLNTLHLDRPDAAERDRLLQATHDAGFLTRPAWTPMHQLEIYRDAPAMDLSLCDRLFDSLISLPSSAKLELDRDP